MRNIEIQEKAQAPSGEPQVREELGLVNREQALHGLHFHHHAPFDQEIEAQPIRQIQLSILKGHMNLPFECKVFRANS